MSRDEALRKAEKARQKRASLYWLLLFLAIAMGVFLYFAKGNWVPVVVAFALLTPWAIGTLYFVLRDD